VAIGQGLLVVLGFSMAMLVATLFLKDLPLRATWGAAPADAPATAPSGETTWA